MLTDVIGSSPVGIWVDAVPTSPAADDERMVSDVAYSIAVVRIFLREMPASCLKELRVIIPSLRVALATAGIHVTRPWRSEPV